MAEAFLLPLTETLNSLIGQRIGLLLGVDKEMKRLSSVLSTICAVLEDAEERQLTDRAIKDWLQKLSDVSCELDDVLDGCELEADKFQTRTWAQKVRSSLSCLSPMNVLFRVKIANKMKEIGDRLDEIADERLKYHLRVSVGEMGRSGRVGESRQTCSIIAEPHVYGREDDKERVVGFLVSDAAKCNDVSVYAIVGLGGLGKTTLAQLVFNDERVSKHFEVKMWVCVSEDFDVKRLVKAIIESASGKGCEALDLDPLQKRLQDMLKGKRFLLVLDDVWNEDQEKWDKLKYVLACGSSGSSIVVTTRLKKVASIMGTVPMHQLSGLSEDDCWSLFSQRAFGSDREEQQNLVKIGKEIVKKCKGVPLAAKALGGLMRFKREESEWLSVMQSDLWNLPEDQLSILPALRLSYFHLPIEHRQCFAYCAIFPKDYNMNKKQLIQLWMANGLILSKRGLEIEDIGNEIFNEFFLRSFFQDEKNISDDIFFKMHDLVHDLAQSIMVDKCHIVELGKDASPINLSKRARHLTCNQKSYSIRIKIPSAQSLRTFLVLSKQPYDCSYYHFKFCSLRALDAEYMHPSIISSLISNLKHLRYLNLSHSRIEILPESVCSFYHLFSLNLSHCESLRKLPKRMCSLRGLRHLYIHGCYKLSHFPPNIGRLTGLKTLTNFTVSRRKGCHLDELCHLNIGAYLEIVNLEKVGSAVEAKSANLSGKRNLEELQLIWDVGNANESQENAEQVLEALIPSPNLLRLSIHNYKGIYFPHWLSNEILGNVTSITLYDCQNCVELPPFGNLALLVDLKIYHARHVRYIDNQCFDGQLKRCFVQLKHLYLADLPNLERLSRETEREMFPCLSDLNVDNCPKLMLPGLESVRVLKVHKVSELLLVSIANLSCLTRLLLFLNDNLTSFPRGMLENLTTLQSLTIHGFTKLQELPTDMLIGCNALERLDISFCHELKCLPEGIFQSSSLLKHITIQSCKKLKSLSDGFGELTALQSLELEDCPELEGFPSSLNHLSSLQNLAMSGTDLKMYGLNSYNYSSEAAHKLVHFPEAFQSLPSLESMAISSFKELASLPDWLGNLQSLRELRLVRCPDLAHIPTSFKRLTNLQTLRIESCPKVNERCQKEVGEDWHKIAHIPDVYVG